MRSVTDHSEWGHFFRIFFSHVNARGKAGGWESHNSVWHGLPQNR